MKWSLAKRVDYYEEVPKGYRVAYDDWVRHYAWAYPIGIHLIVMGIRRLWRASFWYRPDWIETLQIENESLKSQICVLKEDLRKMRHDAACRINPGDPSFEKLKEDCRKIYRFLGMTAPFDLPREEQHEDGSAPGESP